MTVFLEHLIFSFSRQSIKSSIFKDALYWLFLTKISVTSLYFFYFSLLTTWFFSNSSVNIYFSVFVLFYPPPEEIVFLEIDGIDLSNFVLTFGSSYIFIFESRPNRSYFSSSVSTLKLNILAIYFLVKLPSLCSSNYYHIFPI